MNTHDHSVKKSVDTDINQNSQEVPIQADVSGLGSFYAMQRAIYKPSRETLTSDVVLQLQRTIGNHRVAQLIAQSGQNLADPENNSVQQQVNGKREPMLQRQVLFKQSENDYSEPSYETILNWLETGGYRIREQIEAQPEIRDAIEKMMAQRTKHVFNWHGDQREFMKMLPYFRKDGNTIAAEHAQWLLEEGKKYKQGGEYYELLQHQAILKNPMGMFSHYNFFDNNMLWRFTSTPSEEYVKVSEGIDYATILKVIAAHSGGNDKSNPDVKTLSFGRNLGALMGVAASPGGDKHVTNIIDKAEYLYGIDINTLATKGISAHPAMGRLISLFETEYVLVSTPGNPPQSLVDLATVHYKNPFKHDGENILSHITNNQFSMQSRQALATAVQEMGTIVPETVLEAENLPQDKINKILDYARAVYRAAHDFSVSIKDINELKIKDEIDVRTTNKMMDNIPKFIQSLNKNLQQKR
jgi:hypothetical protein